MSKVQQLQGCSDDHSSNLDFDTIVDRITAILEKTGKRDLVPEVPIAVQRALDIVLECSASSVRIVTMGQAAFPSKLSSIRHPPPIVYLRGREELISKKMVAVVGSRKASAEALAIAKKLSARFQAVGYSICNGLAAGIDTAALQLDQGIVSAVGVLGSGLCDRDLKGLAGAYQANAAALIESDNGLLVSIYPPGAKQTAFSAIDACKYQAALSDVVVLVESPEDGGSRFTTNAAIEYGRPLGVVMRSEWAADAECRGLNTSIIDRAGSARRISSPKTGRSSEVVIVKDSASYAELDAAVARGRMSTPLGL